MNSLSQKGRQVINLSANIRNKYLISNFIAIKLLILHKI